MTWEKTDEAGIYQSNDQRYRVRATAKCPRTGTMKQRMKTLPEGSTMKEAIELREELKAALASEVPEETGPPTMTVAEYADQWIDERSAHLKPSTHNTYSDILERWIKPQVGELVINHIVRRDVADWVNWAWSQKKSNGKVYADATVRSWWRVLATMLRDATVDFDLPHDPTRRIRLPKKRTKPRREKRTLSFEQLADFLAVAEKRTPTRYPELATLAYTGMRSGELYGLTWDSIDFENGAIRVEKSVWEGHVSTTKTDEPRVVPLADDLAEVLKEHRKELMRSKHPGLRKNLVFPSNRGTHRVQSSLTKTYKLVSKRAGLDFTVTSQVLRRTFNTLMVRAGVDRIVLRSMMGHADEEMTQRYAGVDIEFKRQALSLLVNRTSE